MNWRKTFIVFFLILVPFFTFKFISDSKFQMFPQFDATDVRITLKANENTTLEEAFKIVSSIEADILEKSDEFYIRNINSIAGYRRDVANNTENFPYAMYMTVELQKLKEMNFKGELYVDMLLVKGIDSSRFFKFYFDGQRFETNKTKVIDYNKDIISLKFKNIEKSFCRTYKNIIKTSTLSYTEKLTMCGEI